MKRTLQTLSRTSCTTLANIRRACQAQRSWRRQQATHSRSGSVVSVEGGWHDIPEEQYTRWRDIFSASTEGARLAAQCPVCGARTLYRWFNLHRPMRIEEFGRTWSGKGGEWEWCRTCRSYQHTSGLVPDWWHPAVTVTPGSLMHDPGPIDAILASEEATD